MKKILLTGAALCALAVPAMAEVAPGLSLYAGAGVGYSTGSGDAQISSIASSIDNNVDGVDAGLFVGTRYMIDPKISLGAEIGFDFLNDVDGKTDLAGLTFNAEKKHSYYIVARPGFNLTKETMLFATAGWQQAKFGADSNTFDFSDEKYSGVRFGGGVEQELAANIKGRLEVTHTEYEEKSFDDGAGGTYSFNPSETNARIGVAYEF